MEPIRRLSSSVGLSRKLFFFFFQDKLFFFKEKYLFSKTFKTSLSALAPTRNKKTGRFFFLIIEINPDFVFRIYPANQYLEDDRLIALSLLA